MIKASSVVAEWLRLARKFDVGYAGRAAVVETSSSITDTGQKWCRVRRKAKAHSARPEFDSLLLHQAGVAQ